jgi:hypothetical protein
MGYGELIKTLQALPEDKRTEVFDFVQYLASRYGTSISPSEWSDPEFSEFAFAQALRGQEDETVEYSNADLRERFQ